jgi:hypothetical protein
MHAAINLIDQHGWIRQNDLLKCWKCRVEQRLYDVLYGGGKPFASIEMLAASWKNGFDRVWGLVPEGYPQSYVRRILGLLNMGISCHDKYCIKRIEM